MHYIIRERGTSMHLAVEEQPRGNHVQALKVHDVPEVWLCSQRGVCCHQPLQLRQGQGGEGMHVSAVVAGAEGSRIAGTIA